MLLPGVAIFVTVVAYNVLGDVLRDIVDPKMKLWLFKLNGYFFNYVEIINSWAIEDRIWFGWSD